MKRYFQTYAESHDGDEGAYYCEVENGIIQRQINVFGDNYYWATPDAYFDERYDYTDQPEFEPTSLEEEISAEEFYRIWQIAVARK